MRVDITSDTAKLKREIMAVARQVRDTAPVARDFGAHMVRTCVLRMPRTAKWQPSAAGQSPARQSGALAASMTFEVASGGDAVEWGSGLVYARVQDEGGTIRPRRARALAIPLNDEARGKRPRDFPDLFLLPADAGDEHVGVLMRKTGVGDGLEGMFVLRKSVRLPARPYLFVAPADEDYLAAALSKRLARERSTPN